MSVITLGISLGIWILLWVVVSITHTGDPDRGRDVLDYGDTEDMT